MRSLERRLETKLSKVSRERREVFKTAIEFDKKTYKAFKKVCAMEEATIVGKLNELMQQYIVSQIK